MKTWGNILKMAALTGTAILLQSMANSAAFMARGYESTGGEIFVFPVVMILGGYLLGFFGSDRKYGDEEDCDNDKNSNIIKFKSGDN